MKIFPNLAGGLRFYFGLARALIMLFAALWFLVLTFGPLIQKLFVDEPKLMISVGEVSLQADPGAVRLDADSAKPGSLALLNLRGSLEMDLLSKDAALVSALRWTVFPMLAVLVPFAWVLFGSLRKLCTNIDQGEVFSENNLRLVRNIGLILIGYSLSAFVVQVLVSHGMDGYLRQHVALTGIKPALTNPGGTGAVHFSPAGQFPGEVGLVAGCMILLLSEAFRQGLKLKTESDLTV